VVHVVQNWGVRSEEWGVRNVECGVWNVECGLRVTWIHVVHVEHELWSMNCGAWGWILFLGHFGSWSSYLKMALKNEFFDFFQTVCFWKAETELEIDLLDFLGSEVIWARERSLEVKFENGQNLDMLYIFGNL
jgi:hypothetical protein